MKTFKNILLLTLFSLSCFQAQGINIRALKSILRNTARLFNTQIKNRNAGLLLTPQEEAQLLRENLFIEKTIRFESDPTVSKRHLPYAYKWFQDFQKKNPDAGFLKDIRLKHKGPTFPDYKSSEQANWFAFEHDDNKLIFASLSTLENIDRAYRKKCHAPHTLSLDEWQLLLESEGTVLHELYHLLPPHLAHGPKVAYDKRNNEDDRKEEFLADEHAIIHATAEQLEAYILFFIREYQAWRSLIPSLNKLIYEQENSFFWQYRKIQKKIKDLNRKLDPQHPSLPERIKYLGDVLDKQLLFV